MSQVSIIVPTWNEAKCLERTLRLLSALQPPTQEILIVDGGSDDATLAIAAEMAFRYRDTVNIKVLNAPQRGRAAQMNWGAAAAVGNIVCFVHADTTVPDDMVSVINNNLADPKVAAGGFISLMTGENSTRWGISLHNFLKTYYAPLLFHPILFCKGLRLLFGDQVIFCRRNDFLACGAFNPALPILEEADLCLKLVRYGRIRQVNRIVQSSDRRVAHWGAAKATLIYLYIGLLWGIGVSPAYLKRFYQEIR